MSLFCLSHNFVYLLYLYPSLDISYDISKTNKGCDLARKGHENAIYEKFPAKKLVNAEKIHYLRILKTMLKLIILPDIVAYPGMMYLAHKILHSIQ